MQNLPGYELIEKGLLDISLNRESYFTALLYSAESKLAKLGIVLGGLRPPDAVSQMYGFLESEFGDVLFSMINYARFLNINPEDALERTNKKFIKRFQYLESKAQELGKPLMEMTLAEMDVFWEEAKKM